MSYIKYTTDYLKQLPASVENGPKLVSFDVNSLYSNIPHDLGIEAIAYWINKHRSEIREVIISEFIIDSIKYILNNNTFNFDGSHYKQVKGTEMGRKMVHIYATLVIGYLEEKLYSKIDEKVGIEFKQGFQDKWTRFLDDCFVLWNRNEDDLLCLIDIFQTLHPSLDP